MTELEKAELIDHYKMLVNLAKVNYNFSPQENFFNKKIWEILLDLKTKEEWR